MSVSRGCWKIGNKELNEIDHVQITSSRRPSEIVRQEYYVLSGMLPDLRDLPWMDDLTPEEKRKIEFNTEGT